MSASPPRAPALLALAASAAMGLWQCKQDLRDDDWAYLRWAGSAGRWDFLLQPPPYPYFRPLNALIWQVQGRVFGTDPWPFEILLLGLWGLGLALLYRIAAGRSGPWIGLVAVLLALATPEIRTLPNWRSWMTTVGAMVGLLGALHACRRPSAAAPLGWVVLGAGFKEGAWLQGGLALGALGRWRIAALSLVAYGVHAAVTAHLHTPGEIGLGFVPHNATALVSTWVRWGWPVVLGVLAQSAPRESWRDGSAGLVLAGLLGSLPTLGFYLYNPVYAVEPSLLLMLGLLGPATDAVRSWTGQGRLALAALALWLALPPLRDDQENIAWQRRRMVEGRAMLLGLGPVTAVWAPSGDPGPCGLAAELLVHQGAARAYDRPDGRSVSDCLVVK